MKLHIITGFSEYFYPHLVTSLHGFCGAVDEIAIPDLSWLPSYQAASSTAVEAVYHGDLLAGDGRFNRSNLVVNYIRDTLPVEGEAGLLFPYESLRAASSVATGFQAFVATARDLLGASNVLQSRLSPSREADVVLRALYARSGGHPLGVRETEREFVPRPASPLSRALLRNYTHNAVRLGLSLALKSQDDLFDEGERPTLLAEAIDRQGMLLNPDAKLSSLLDYCSRVARSALPGLGVVDEKSPAHDPRVLSPAETP